MGSSGEMACANWKVGKIYTPKNQYFCAKNEKIIGNFLKRILVDNSISEHLNQHECNNIGTYKRDICLFMMSNPERCADLFVVMLKLEGAMGGWFKTNVSVVRI